MSQLLEQILARDNMMSAYKKVKAKGGTSGIDGITTKDVRDYLVKNWTRIREQIRKRNVFAESVLFAMSHNLGWLHTRIQNDKLDEHLYELKPDLDAA